MKSRIVIILLLSTVVIFWLEAAPARAVESGLPKTGTIGAVAPSTGEAKICTAELRQMSRSGKPPLTAGVNVPRPPKGKGEVCVADTDYMRRFHMDLLAHQRDDTVREGIRTKRFSLKECIACHVVNGPDAQPVTYDNPNHFCRVCHDYTGVKIRCFECHASRPPLGLRSTLPPQGGDAKALARYLKDVEQ